MKKIYIVILPILLLVSCKNTDAFADKISEKYKSSAAISIEAEIAAEFADRTDVYKVLYNHAKGCESTIKVLSPESISGIEATIGEDCTVFKFKDAILETGMDLSNVSPLNVLHKLVTVWSFDTAVQTGNDGDNVLLVFNEGEWEYRTLFSKDYLPISAEVICDSKTRMKIKFLKCEGITNDN